MNAVLDAGALIAIDRADRRVAGLIALIRRAGGGLLTSTPVLAQAWRDGARQARLARAIAMVDVRSVELSDAKVAGVLLAKAGTADVVDALLALLVAPADQVFTSDPEDIRNLVTCREIRADIVQV